MTSLVSPAGSMTPNLERQRFQSATMPRDRILINLGINRREVGCRLRHC